MLQCVAVCCSALIALRHGVISLDGTSSVCCSVLQLVAACCSALQCVAVCCNMLQFVAVCCNALQRIAVRCSVLRAAALRDLSRWQICVRVAVCCSVLQCVCCIVLQCSAVCSGAFQCVAVCCSAFQCVAACPNALQCDSSKDALQDDPFFFSFFFRASTLRDAPTWRSSMCVSNVSAVRCSVFQCLFFFVCKCVCCCMV